MSKKDPSQKLVPYDFSPLLYNTKFSDYTLIIQNAPQTKMSKVPVHRFLLSSRSNYFKEYFIQNARSNKIILWLPDYYIEQIYSFIEYFYTLKPIQLNDDNVANVMHISILWGVDEVKEEASKYIINKLSYGANLRVLVQLIDYIDSNGDVYHSLTKNIVNNFLVYKKEDFADLPFSTFEFITEEVCSKRPNENIIDAICNSIEYYIVNNIEKLGKGEFESLVVKFSIETHHSGMVTLYEYSLIHNWCVSIIESKLLHSWRFLDMKRLAKFPIDRLSVLIDKNFINVDSEDEIYDFIKLVHEFRSENKQQEPSEFARDMNTLWGKLRAPLLSESGKNDICRNEIVPNFVKETLNSSAIVNKRRLPYSSTRCLIIGAADDDALNDVKDMLISGGLAESNLYKVRGDKKIDISFDYFHAILIFGFYKFYEAEKLSQNLYNFYSNGGGLVICYGANRPDDFGLGQPLLMELPIEFKSIGNEFQKSLDPEKSQTIGSKHFRMVCRAKNPSQVLINWDDNVPFIVTNKSHCPLCEGPRLSSPTKEGRFRRSSSHASLPLRDGGITIFNASPVSSKILPGQWESNNKSMAGILMEAIIATVNCQ